MRSRGCGCRNTSSRVESLRLGWSAVAPSSFADAALGRTSAHRSAVNVGVPIHRRRVSSWFVGPCITETGFMPADRRCANILPSVCRGTGQSLGTALCALGRWPDAMGRCRIVSARPGARRVVQPERTRLRGAARQCSLRQERAVAFRGPSPLGRPDGRIRRRLVDATGLHADGGLVARPEHLGRRGIP